MYIRADGRARVGDPPRSGENRGRGIATLVGSPLEAELSSGAEDRFPIIRGTRIYIVERGNKYGVYTAVHLHGNGRANGTARPFLHRGTIGRSRGINSWPAANISASRSRFARYKWTPPTSRQLRNYETTILNRPAAASANLRHRQWRDAKEREHVAKGGDD